MTLVFLAWFLIPKQPGRLSKNRLSWAAYQAATQSDKHPRSCCTSTAKIADTLHTASACSRCTLNAKHEFCIHYRAVCFKLQVNPSMTAQNSWTPLWAAPEVICHERASIKADIWSFGIIVWELISQQNIADFPALGMSCQMKVEVTYHSGRAPPAAYIYTYDTDFAPVPEFLTNI